MIDPWAHRDTAAEDSKWSFGPVSSFNVRIKRIHELIENVFLMGKSVSIDSIDSATDFTICCGDPAKCGLVDGIRSKWTISIGQSISIH